MIVENKKEVLRRVSKLIAAHRKDFEDKSNQEREKLKIQAEERGNELSVKRHHRVICPACQCAATVQGTAFGKESVSNEEDVIIVRQAVAPTNFECPACGLRLAGYAELEAASVGGHYTRRTTYTPAEYYGLFDQDDLDEYVKSGIDEFVQGEMDEYLEYDNEQ